MFSEIQAEQRIVFPQIARKKSSARGTLSAFVSTGRSIHGTSNAPHRSIKFKIDFMNSFGTEAAFRVISERMPSKQATQAFETGIVGTAVFRVLLEEGEDLWLDSENCGAFFIDFARTAIQASSVYFLYEILEAFNCRTSNGLADQGFPGGRVKLFRTKRIFFSRNDCRIFGF